MALLHLIPADPAILATVDNIVSSNHTIDVDYQSTSNTSTSNNSSPHKPLTVSHSTGSTYDGQTSADSGESGSASKLSSLFNRPGTGRKGTSPFRVRYNLEVRIFGLIVVSAVLSLPI